MTEPSKYTIHTELNQIIETNTSTVIGKGIQRTRSIGFFTVLPINIARHYR